MPEHASGDVLTRRRFLGSASKTTAAVLIGGPAFLAACSAEDDPVLGAPGGPTGATTPSDGPTTAPADLTEARVLVGDVVDFALTSDEWAGAFGFVTLRLHEAVVNGEPAYFIRTDASDVEYAQREQVVHVPRLQALLEPGLTGDAFVSEGAPTVLSSAPHLDDYTPAWRIHEVAWNGEARPLGSVDEVRTAEAAGELTVTSTDVVINGPVVVWPGGAMAIDTERTGYLGPGQLLEEPDLEAMTVTFKLHECFPGSRYIVVDTSAPPMASGMNIAAAPRLNGSSEAGATGRVNVFGNGIEGPGPMGFQPSVFDSRAGDPVWSPYWDHLTYVWVEGAAGRVLRTEAEIHVARDAGDLDEFVGTPDTGGQGFVVNCPVPVVAPSTFGA